MKRRITLLLGIGLCASSALAQVVPTVPDELAAYKKLSLAELMNVEVTSVSRRPEKLSDAASAIQVISGDDIRRAGATSLPEALRLATNLEVAQIDSRQWAISARGFNNTVTNKLLVLMDGRTIYTPLFAGVFWDVQDTLLDDVDRIEVISGPGATQWGANAVNGVINIRTKNAKDTQGTLVYGGVGNELENFGGVRYGGSIDPALSYRVYAKYFDRDASVLPSGSPSTDAWSFGQTGFRMDWDPETENALTLQGDAYGGHVAQPTFPNIAVSGGNVEGRWTHAAEPGADLTLQTYYDYTHRRIPGSITEDLGTYDLDLQHHFPWGERHQFVWGAGYRFIDDRVKNSPTIAFYPRHVLRDWYNAFAQDEIALQPHLHATLGAKAEHNPYTGMEFQPSVRLAWQVEPGQLLWAAVSRAVRTPSRIDREFYIPASPPYTIAGGPDFRSEKLIAYEVGYRTQPRDNVVLSLSTFYQDYDDLRSLEPIDPSAVFPAIIGNGQRGKSYGAELALDYRITTSWRVHFGYTELRAYSELKPGSHDTTSLRSVALDPNRQFQVRSQLDLPDHWEFDGTLRYVGAIANQDVPAYTEMDLHLGWRPVEQWEFSLVGQNLLHRQHVEFGAPTNRHEIERAVYGKITWRF